MSTALVLQSISQHGPTSRWNRFVYAAGRHRSTQPVRVGPCARAQRRRLESKSYGESEQPRRIDIRDSKTNAVDIRKLDVRDRHNAGIKIQHHMIAHPA